MNLLKKLPLLACILLYTNVMGQTFAEGFESSLNNWTTYQIVGKHAFARTTSQANTGNYSAFAMTPNAIGAFNALNNETWLISQPLDLSAASSVSLTYFERNRNPPGAGALNPVAQQVMYSTNYSGSGNPNNATWTVIHNQFASNTWTQNTILNQIPTSGNVYIAFRYRGVSTTFFWVPYSSREWYLDEIEVLSLPCPYSTTWNGSAWSNGLPDQNTTAIINGNYNTRTNGDLETCNLVINSGNTLNIRNNDYVSIHNDFINNGTVNVRNRGSFYMINDNALISGSGTFKVHKRTTTLNNFMDFTYWSSPVENSDLNTVFSGVERKFEWIIPSGNAANGVSGGWQVASGTMTTGKGYIAEASTTTPANSRYSVVFTGKPNNGLVTRTIGIRNDNSPQTNFNLVGNPYPSALDADLWIQNPINSGLFDGTLWFWTHNTQISKGTTGEFTVNDYATYNLSGGTKATSGGVTPNKNIGVAQGFFIRATANGNIVYNNNMRLKNNNNRFFKPTNDKNKISSEKDRIWLNVTSKTGGAFKQMLVGFFDNATDGVDHGYDGGSISSSYINIYSVIDSVKYAIQGMGTFHIDKTVVLGFDTYINQEMEYTISIDNVEGQLRNTDGIYLKDKKLDIIHDLNEAPYVFSESENSKNIDRFTLFFNNENATLPTKELDNPESLKIYSNTDHLEIRSRRLFKTVKLYDITGRLLVNENINSSSLSLSKGSIKNGTVVIVQVIFNDNTMVNEKLIL